MPADPGRVAEAERLVAEGPDKPFLDVRFHDGEHGLVVGAYGLAFSTDDGGRHWTPRLNIPNPRGLHLYRIALAGERVYIAGEQGALFYSRDGGENFSVLPSPYEGSYFGLLAAPDGLLLVFGLRGNLFRSDDAGQSWQAIDSGGSVALADGLYAGDGSLVLVDQAGRVLRSRDRGRTFQSRLIASAGPVASVVESGDGSLLLGGLHGITRVPLASNSAGGAQ
ncbi:Ycf48-like protein [compost metagenome]